jgi:type I restriction enzyme S subunit
MLNIINGEPEIRFKEFSGEWLEKRLGKIGKIYQPKTISEKEFTKDGYPVYGANGCIGYYKEYNHKKWQVIITCRGSTCGTINKTKDKCWITGNSMVINVDENYNLSKLFLFYLLQIQHFQKIVEGSGQPQITQKSLQNFKINITPILAEQEKIAEFLLNIDKKIELEENRLEKIKEYKKDLLQKMFV